MAETKAKRRDQILSDEFVKAYNRLTGSSYAIQEWEDAKGGSNRRVEAIAVDTVGHLLAIEHTLVQVFEGEKADNHRLNLVTGPAEKANLNTPGFYTNISLAILEEGSTAFASVPKGTNWTGEGKQLLAWLQQHSENLSEGLHQITPRIRIDVQRERIPDYEGEIRFSRHGLKANHGHQAVRNAIAKKLPKLMEAKAHKRVLLLEQDSPVGNPGSELPGLREDFPELDEIEVWQVITFCAPLYFLQVLPHSHDRRISVERPPGLPSSTRR